MLRSLIVSGLIGLAIASSARAQELCEGAKPIPHDDGFYRFNTESWRRYGAGVHHYGRCVDVQPPTQDMINSWVGVLPPNSIAREGRPTVGGLDFIEEKSVDASADLYYGNSDSKMVASYISHEEELNSRRRRSTPD